MFFIHHRNQSNVSGAAETIIIPSCYAPHFSKNECKAQGEIRYREILPDLRLQFARASVSLKNHGRSNHIEEALLLAPVSVEEPQDQCLMHSGWTAAASPKNELEYQIHVEMNFISTHTSLLGLQSLLLLPSYQDLVLITSTYPKTGSLWVRGEFKAHQDRHSCMILFTIKE